jgi:AcrR family transcriptional regulator
VVKEKEVIVLVHINDKFKSLDTQKQEGIINAAIAEFSRNGYKNASTNQIVKDANISKGLLFHYFGSKKNLFLYLYKYCLDLSIIEFDAIQDSPQKDLFEQVKHIHLIKLGINKRHPDIFKFIESAYIETDEGLKPEIDRLNDETKMSSVNTFIKSIIPPN